MTLLKTLSFVVLAGFASVSLAAGDAAAGQAKSAMCAACHGPDGNSPVAMYPKLAGQGEKYLAKQLRDFRSGLRANPIMMGMSAGLSDQDIADLAAFYAGQKNAPQAADPAQVALGEKVWRGGNPANGVPACSGCHGPSGRGIADAAYPALRFQHPDYVEAQLKAFRAAARGDMGVDHRANDTEGVMRGVARGLSDAEIKAVAQFVSGLYQ